MVEIVCIVILGLLVIAQAVERYLYSKEVTKQLGNATKAIMSRNINDYLNATQEKPKDTDFQENDEVDLSEISDEEFLKTIKS